ncbi:MAG: ATPase [Lutibacter sp.]|jgi:cation transport ATPase|nr:ATPase [Lutibacter sp.]
MKRAIIIGSMLLLSLTVHAQKNIKKTRATIEVKGICEMCKDRIESTAYRTKGVKFALWSIETHQLSLIFDGRKIDTLGIQQQMARAGHDTHPIKADKEAYQSLHDCCKYRDIQVIEDHKIP